MIHSSDRLEFDRMLDYCFFLSDASAAEACQVLKVGRVWGSERNRRIR
jgi:hypothetical protein